METKICTKCGLEKPLTEFNFKNKAKGKLQAQCKECQRKRERELYNMSYKQKNKDKYNENRRAYRSKMRDIINKAKECGCIYCGEMDTCCLDFHHLHDKELVISAGTEVSLERLLAELDKCVVLCANCHRKLHAGKINLAGDEPDGVTITETTVNTTKLKIYKQMTIKFKKILEKAVQPVRTNGAGYNLVATDIATDVNERGQVNIVYRTGLGVEIPEGYVGIINTPADIYKKTLRMCSSPILSGNIDDEVMVRYMNTTDVVPAVYKDGDVVANLTIVKAEDVGFEEFIDTTSSATESEQGLPETEGEPTNPDITEAVSGGETNIPEQAQ